MKDLNEYILWQPFYKSTSPMVLVYMGSDAPKYEIMCAADVTVGAAQRAAAQWRQNSKSPNFDMGG